MLDEIASLDGPADRAHRGAGGRHVSDRQDRDTASYFDYVVGPHSLKDYVFPAAVDAPGVPLRGWPAGDRDGRRTRSCRWP